MRLDLPGVSHRNGVRVGATAGPAGRPAADPPADPPAPCVHQGDDLTGPERQAAGLGHARRWLHCLNPEQPLGPHVCSCKGCGPTCRGYQAEEIDTPAPVDYPPVGRRHLAYFLLPVAGNGVWRRGVDQLRRRWGLFTGRTVVAVATGGAVTEQQTGRVLALDPPATVRAYLPPGCEVVEVPNDPGRWELAGWGALWGRVLDGADDADAVLYCHAKGVTRPADSTCHLWADTLYALCLDHWPEVAAAVHTHALAGPLKKLGHFFREARPHAPAMARSAWHYSGNFWWARAGVVRDRLARVPVPADPWGTEAWPGIAFRPDEGAGVGPAAAGDLYRPATWRDEVLPALDRWQNLHHPTPPVPRPVGPPARPPDPRPRLSVVIPTAGRDTLGRTLASLTPQLLPGDEVILVRDDTGDWGATPRNRAIPRAAGDYLLFMDDDDEYTPGGLEAVRSAAAEHPGRPLVFRMRRPNDVLPAVRELVAGQVSTQMFAVPNDPARLAAWPPVYTGDFEFIRAVCGQYPAGPVWRDEVIAVWRPQEAPS